MSEIRKRWAVFPRNQQTALSWQQAHDKGEGVIIIQQEPGITTNFNKFQAREANPVFGQFLESGKSHPLLPEEGGKDIPELVLQ